MCGIWWEYTPHPIFLSQIRELSFFSLLSFIFFSFSLKTNKEKSKLKFLVGYYIIPLSVDGFHLEWIVSLFFLSKGRISFAQVKLGWVWFVLLPNPNKKTSIWVGQAGFVLYFYKIQIKPIRQKWVGLG